jgi:hypothetical protein
VQHHFGILYINTYIQVRTCFIGARRDEGAREKVRPPPAKKCGIHYILYITPYMLYGSSSWLRSLGGDHLAEISG